MNSIPTVICKREVESLQSLNIKNPRAYVLAAELSRLTGETLTSAVITALEKRLEAERIARSGKGKAERIREFAKNFRVGMTPGSHSSQHGDIYGDDGLPE